MDQKVIVIVPTHDVGRWVREAVDSVLGQTYPHVRAIVVDDGSTDDCIRFLDDIRDDRLRVVRQPNAGVSAARNTGRALEDGDVYAFLDADDVWYPTKLERSLPLLGQYAAVGSRMRYIGEDGAPLRAAAGMSPTDADTFDAIRRAEIMPFPISSMLFRAEAVRLAGDFDVLLPQGEDIDFLARVADVGPIGWVDEPLGGYRLRSTSLSAARQDEQKMVWRFVMARKTIRAAGGDLGLEEFRRGYRIDRATRWRDRSAALYRSGGLRVANRQWSGVALLLAAALRSPSYAIPRLLRQGR